ncbi:hypothetical protein D3C76_1205920 [compost metagenome]
MAANLDGITAEDLIERIARVEAVVIVDKWAEFQGEAALAKDSTLTVLKQALISRQQYEADQAELAQRRADDEARAQRERDEQIRKDAAEQAQRDADEAARLERVQAEQRERQLREQAEQAEQREKQAKADLEAAEQRAEQERRDSAARAEKAAEDAKNAEIKRQADAAVEAKRQADAREADKTHQAKINRAALKAFIDGGMPEGCAKQAVTLIAQRKIPSVSITY